MKEARLIVIAVEKTGGIMWELEELRANNHLDKTLFLFPPGSATNRALLGEVAERLGVRVDDDNEGSRGFDDFFRSLRSQSFLSLSVDDGEHALLVASYETSANEYELVLRSWLNSPKVQGLLAEAQQAGN
jgi:hypothetical protein